ncbi:hypothetical protein MVEN_02457000 [Mycena venus]|uniref:DUF6534 domain-containing protein n=1 Tax=Mycena venus TaxID=2733690 RepID=A0A8H6WX95_9AGAR|nr:hypothetical protein MVEN_02457000 [Mycena venus]
MSPPTLPSTYGAWLISLFLETMLYGIGILQTFLYFQWWSNDGWSIVGPVIVVMSFETIQISFFFRSTYYRFVQRFGMVQGDLIWSDSLQLLANYLTAFAVQLYFASRIYRLTRESVKMATTSSAGIYVVILLALVQISAGIAQTIMSYKLRSYAELRKTTAITTLQTAASCACDVAITVYLCVFLHRNKQGLPRTEKLLNSLMMNAVNRGMLTAGTSAFTMALFLKWPDRFWFFLSLAPNSKLYMNSMLATLNMRQHVRDKAYSNEWNTIDLGARPSSTPRTGHPSMVSAVEFVKPDDSHPGTGTMTMTVTETEYPSSLSVAMIHDHRACEY